MTTLNKRRRKKRIIRRLIKAGILILPLTLIIIIFSFFMKDLNNKKDKTEELISIQHEEQSVNAEKESEKEPELITVSILSAGDIIMHDPFLTSNLYKKTDGTYDYNSIFKYIKGRYESADFMVVNLESTITDSNYKAYPKFRSPAAITTALMQNSVDACLLANNHIYDNFDAGLRMTIDAVETNSMVYMGVRKTTTEKKYTIKEINGIKIGFFNYVYESGKSGNSNISINAIPVNNETAPLINTFNNGNVDALLSNVKAGLEEMKAEGVDYTIAYIHWGVEYATTENSRQRQIAAGLCELGIDALIGGHPHVVQPVDLLTNTAGDHQMLCAYSMGNHLSNQYKERMETTKPTGHTEDGLMVNLILQRNDDNSISLIKADFIPTWVYRTQGEPDTGNPEFFILPLDDPNGIIKKVAPLDIETDVYESLTRTNEIIAAGVEKVQKALPIRKR